MLYYLVFDTLVALDLSDKTLQTIKPRMAESWDISPDPPAWFSLKDQAKLEAACTANPTDASKCGGTEAFAGVTAPDDYTVVFTLEAPDVFFLRTMVDAPSVIMPAHILQGQTADQINKSDFKNKQPIGTGPFTLKAIVRRMPAERCRRAPVHRVRRKPRLLRWPAQARFRVLQGDQDRHGTGPGGER